MLTSYIYAGATILCWSTVAAAFKIALRELDHVQLLFLASWASTLSLTAALGFSRQRRRLWSPSPGWTRSILMGLVNPALYYLVLFKAYSLLPAQEAQPLNWTWPLTLTLFSALFLGQRLNRRTLLAMALAFAGVWVIVTRGEVLGWRLSEPLGDALAVGSSLLWAGYWVMNLRDGRDPVEKLYWNFLFGSLWATAALLLLSEPPAWTLRNLTAGAYIGVFEMGAAFVLWLKALSLAKSAASVSLLAYLTPFVSLLFIHFALGETVLLSSLAGLGLIVGGIVMQGGRSNA